METLIFTLKVKTSDFFLLFFKEIFHHWTLENLQKEHVEGGDVIYIELHSGAVDVSLYYCRLRRQLLFLSKSFTTEEVCHQSDCHIYLIKTKTNKVHKGVCLLYIYIFIFGKAITYISKINFPFISIQFKYFK